MHWSVIYGLSAVSVCLVTWLSREAATQKLSLILLASWAVSNVIHRYTHPPDALMLNAILDMTLMAMAITVIKTHQGSDWLLFPMCVLFLAMLCFHVVWLRSNHPPYYDYNLSLNLLFAAQLLLVGGRGAFVLVGRLLSGDSVAGLVRSALHGGASLK